MFRIYIQILVVGVLILSCRNTNKEVLDAFGKMNQRFIEVNSKEQKALDSLYKVIEANKSTVNLRKANMFVKQSDSLYNYIAYLKNTLLKTAGVEKDDYKAMGNTQIGNRFFFTNEAHAAKGKEFLTQVHAYVGQIEELFSKGHPEVYQQISNQFSQENGD